MTIKLRAKKIGRFYQLQKLVDNQVTEVVDHNFRSMIDCSIYGNKINNPMLANPKTIYEWRKV